MSIVNVYQIDCRVYLLKNIRLSHILEEISHFVDSCLSKSEEMLRFHISRGFKNYSHSGFYELEKDKVYKEGKIYSFSVRCVDDLLKDFLYKTLPDTRTWKMKGLTTTVKRIPKVYIERIYTLTPALLKLEGGYWQGQIDFLAYQKRIIENSFKKAKSLIGEFDESFVLYEGIQKLNKKPIACGYKGITLLGDKLELIISNNEMAQLISYILLGTGILEGNPRGYGFLNYRSSSP